MLCCTKSLAEAKRVSEKQVITRVRVSILPNAEVSDGGPLTHEQPAAQSRRSLH